jgi:hypothetical protein
VRASQQFGLREGCDGLRLQAQQRPAECRRIPLPLRQYSAMPRSVFF